MPLYEFECLDCKKEFEVIVRNAEAAGEVICKHCNSANIRKKISAGSFHSKSAGTALPGSGCTARGGFT